MRLLCRPGRRLPPVVASTSRPSCGMTRSSSCKEGALEASAAGVETHPVLSVQQEASRATGSGSALRSPRGHCPPGDGEARLRVCQHAGKGLDVRDARCVPHEGQDAARRGSQAVGFLGTRLHKEGGACMPGAMAPTVPSWGSGSPPVTAQGGRQLTSICPEGPAPGSSPMRAVFSVPGV